MYKIIAKLTTTARCFSRSPPAVRRLYSTTTKPPPLPHHHQFNPNPATLCMINYAFSFSGSHKSDESYGEGLFVLKHCEGLVLLPIDKIFSKRGNIVEALEKLNTIDGLMVVSFPLKVESYEQVLLVLELCEGNQHDSISKGLVLLAISTLLSERGNIVEAIEKLNTIKDLEVASFPLKVAATEALAGLHLELGEDDTSSVIADGCLNDLDAIKAELGDGFRSFDTRARALKGLIELARGNADSSQSWFKDVEGNLGIGNDALSYAEFLHTTRDFSTAKQLYQKVIKEIPETTKDYSDPYNLAAGNMAREDILMAATCALGQLESHMGNFGGAEEILTRALTMTEERFG